MVRPILFFAALVCFSFGCAKEKAAEQPAPSTAVPAPGGVAPTAPKEAGADFKLTAAEFEKEYKSDPKATKAKYAGKTLEVSGVIKYTQPNYYAKGTTIAFAPAEPFGNTVDCLTKGFLPPGTLAKGQTVRVLGKATVLGSLLTECVVLEKGPDTAVRTTAEQIAKDYTADPEKALAKYDGKTLVVVGDVSAVKPDVGAPNIKVVELKGDGQTVIQCRFGGSDEERKFVDSCKAGDKVTFATEMIRAEKGLFVVGMCYPVSDKR